MIELNSNTNEQQFTKKQRDQNKWPSDSGR